MKKIIIVILFVINITNAQEKIPFIDYDSIQPQIEESSKAKDFTKTLALINKINKNDSMYFPLLTSKSYYLLQLKKYEEVIVVADEGLNADHKNSKLYFYTNKGVALTNLEKYDEALDTYNEGIKTYPKNYLLWFNKGVVLETKGKINEALAAYKEAIILNPLYKKPHLQIGNIFYKQERLTQALMAFNVYILLDPNGAGTFSALQRLNNIVVAKNTNKRNEELTLLDADDSFEDIDLVLKSKVAVNENYKTNSDINIALTKQNHAMIQQLKGFQGNEGFWSQKYVPLYNWILENNHFNNFTFTLSYTIENEKYKKIIKKKLAIIRVMDTLL